MPKTEHATKPIPHDVFERHESEWRQMQTGRLPAPKPSAAPAQN